MCPARPRRRRTPRRPALLVACLLALGLPTPPAHAGPRPVPQDDPDAKSFSIPETRQARALFDRAQTHLAAERWPEAIADLQELVVEHRGDLLAREAPAPDRAPSLQPVHPGVADAARRALFALPAEARELYADRFAADADAALERARRTANRRALIEVARRWPVARAAREAWWTVGDLELELGNRRAAADAWKRAEDLYELAAEPVPAGGLARLALVAEGADSPGLGGIEGAQVGERTVPGPDGHSWRQPVDVGSMRVPFGADSPPSYNLFPARAGDTLLVSNSLRVFAFDAWTGKERWRSDEPPGWDRVDAKEMYALRDGEKLDRSDLFDAIDRRSVMIAPAAAGGIVVAQLQIPMTQLGNTRYQNIPITRAIPDRRLFAFDLATGRELWNHLPPPLWDGESGEFSERMRVAAPPVISGTRVLVPVYRMQGRIDYHLACYDLFTGSLLWSTSLISGQLPLNMFGRHSEEFAAAPGHVEGDRVLTVTQLGTVAACDLYTGEVLWQTLYEQIPLPPTHNWSPRKRRLSWRNAAPLVEDGVVIATPLDSRNLIGLDLEGGSMIWSVPYDRLQRRGDYMRLALLGAEEDTVYLAGRVVMSCRAPAGLGSKSGPVEVVYGAELPVEHQEDLPRPALGDTHIVAPTSHRRVTVDRRSIRYEDRALSADWGPEQTAGNVLLGEGALFLLSNRHLTAIFDWNVLERRAAERYAAEPGNDRLAMAYAELLAGRGRSEIDQTRLAPAIEHLTRAREIVSARLAAEDRGYHGELEALQHRVLRDEAEALRRSVRPWSQVLELLRRAEALAPTEADLRDTLLTMADLLDGAGARSEWLAVIDRLERRCGDLPMTSDGRAVPVSLWVAFERGRDHARSGSVGPELEVLHGILASHGDAVLEGYEPWLGQDRDELRVSRRIADLLEEHGRGPYAPFEADRFPHSRAAIEAADARIATAFAQGQTKKVVSLVQRSLPERFRMADADPRQVGLLMSMGRALARDGNVELYACMVRELAFAHGELVPPTEADTGRTLATLAAELDSASRTTVAPIDFDRSARVQAVVNGSFDLLETSPALGDRPALMLTVRDSQHSDAVTAFSAADPSRPLWVKDIEGGVIGVRERASYLARDTLTVAGASAVVGLDLSDGKISWRWNADHRGVAGVTGASGVSLGAFGSVRRGALLRAFDATRGYLLWTREVASEEHWPIPICGDGRAVLLPRSSAYGAVVIDLFTGSELLKIDVGEVHDGDLAGAWIDDGNLVLPRFPKTTASKEVISAWSLDTGVRRWTVENSENLDFDSVARTADQVYLVYSAGRQRPGAIQQLDPRVGAVRKINVTVRPGDVPIGMERHRVTELDGDWMFLQSRSETSASETIVRAIHLPFGEKWRHRLPVAPSEIYDALPLPVSSESTTVLAWTEPTRDLSVRPMTQLLLLDREFGTLQDTRNLTPDLGPAGHITFAFLGRSLAILGHHETAFLAR